MSFLTIRGGSDITSLPNHLPVIRGSVSTASTRRVRTSICSIADRMAPYLGAGLEVDCAQLPRLNHHLAPDQPAGDIGLVDETGAREEEPSRRCVMSKLCYLRAGLEGVDGPLPDATVRCVASAGEQVTCIRRNGS